MNVSEISINDSGWRWIREIMIRERRANKENKESLSVCIDENGAFREKGGRERIIE